MANSVLPGTEVLYALDREIHEKVMRVTWDESRCRVCGWPMDLGEGQGPTCLPDNCSMRPAPQRRADAIPAYSSDIAMAWPVVEQMRAEGFYIDVEAYSWGYSARCSRAGKGDEDIWIDGAPFKADAAPEAIARAALSVRRDGGTDG